MTATGTDIPLTIAQGQTFLGTVTWYQGDDNTGPVISLVNAVEIRMQIRRQQGSPVLLEASSIGLSPEITHNGAGGVVTLHLKPESTALLSSKRCVYDLEVEWGTGDVDPISRGVVTVVPNITQGPGEPIVR